MSMTPFRTALAAATLALAGIAAPAQAAPGPDAGLLNAPDGIVAVRYGHHGYGHRHHHRHWHHHHRRWGHRHGWRHHHHHRGHWGHRHYRY